ncbi:MAG TPA: hypothetical protein VNM24_09980 [Burkholderiales bacterium]|nr:hypothetical protein [Burkholderiales bacterium]
MPRWLRRNRTVVALSVAETMGAIGALEDAEDRRVAISPEQSGRGSVTTVANCFSASVRARCC